MSKQTIIIVGCLAILGLLIAGISVMQQRNISPLEVLRGVVPTPTDVFLAGETRGNSTIPAETTSYEQSMQTIYKSEDQIIEREGAIGKLLDLVPQRGTNFTLTFDFDQAQYVVIIPSDKRTEGDAEFDAFLKQNGIQSRAWFREGLLLIQYP
jgi:hypothetical protein